jgi:prepilin-type N-terminal cleavage/methylation domain-containing protein
MLRVKRGFTLIEVMVVIGLTALIMPAIGLAFYQLMVVPPQESRELTSINDMSLALSWLNRDGMRAQDFSLAPEPLYGSFYWMDRTSGNVSHSYAARYYYDDGRLLREEWRDNALNSTFVVARHIANYSDVSFEYYPKGDWPAGNFSEVQLPYVVVTIKTTDGQGTAVQSAEGSQYVYLRGGEPLSRGFAILTMGSGSYTLDISGNNLAIDGDIRSYGGISTSGSGHTVNGTAQAAWLIDDDADAIDDNQEEEYARLPRISWSLILSDFQPYTFNFTGDVNLADEDVWNGTTLMPGVYYTTGNMTLATNNASGMVTLIGDKVEVKADNTQLWPFCNGVLLYSTGDELEFSGDGGTLYGTLFASYDLVKMTGSGLILYGAIAAQTFTHTNNDAGVQIQF